ncbi:MFS transporter [Rhodoplanes serenus]|jgi:MHS family proline/betaine transporter-like MFS transporter|uniref:MFS transporter n=1 Tax=Rhodoplanes serenus TaxID=200615 RepID=A0A327K578_9BRAD|nr:MFS transporter [Rhodoplanes serenus]MTW18690.1 MFS transporter [Rhodoplanes serenus]RAI33839.1 MFS transporter [Rhodoplanes serenus]
MSGTIAIDDRTRNRALAGGIWGTIVEWYDYAIYGFLATIIARNFFPSEDETTGLLAAFATFGIGFVARPLGGILIGRMGDVVGRKSALITTLFMMAVSTVAIGLLPTYAAIGIWAPTCLVVLRLLQGFSAGGEWGSSAAFIVEWAPQERRGFFGSLQQVSVGLGLLLGSGTAALLSTILSAEQMGSFGWRIPFIIGGVLLPIGMYLRNNVDETPIFREEHAHAAKAPESTTRLAVKAFALTIIWTVGFYIVLTYMPTFTERQVGLSKTEALWSNTLGLLCFALVIPLMGHLSDRVGRKPVLIGSVVAFLVLVYPLFTLMLTAKSLAAVVAVQLVLAVMLAAFSGPGPAALVEIFQTAGRATWMSTAYSLAVAIFGGFAPYISTWLIKVTGTPIAPTFYLIGAAIVSLAAAWSLRETAFEKLK